MGTSDPIGPGRGRAVYTRPVVVVDDLGSLRGPVVGRVRLPLHLDASARAELDLADPARRRLLYETVLTEAADVSDLERWLDGDELLATWSWLYLPRPVRTAWEDRHPELRARGAGVDVPRPR